VYIRGRAVQGSWEDEHAFKAALFAVRAARLLAAGRQGEILEVTSDSGAEAKSDASRCACDRGQETHLRMRHAPQAENCWREDLGWPDARRDCRGGYGGLAEELLDAGVEALGGIGENLKKREGRRKKEGERRGEENGGGDDKWKRKDDQKDSMSGKN